LDVAARLSLGFDYIMTLLGHVLDEHLLVGINLMLFDKDDQEPTVANVITNAALFEHMFMSWSSAIIFFTLDTEIVSMFNRRRRLWSLRGSCAWPVGSLRGGMAVVLYGISGSEMKGFL
jgi:hypothetical protein